MAEKVVLTTDLSPEGFKKLAQTLNDMANGTLKRFSNRMITLSMRELKQLARNNLESRVGQTGYEPTGTMANSFQILRQGNVGLLINTDENSAAVEFGTGIPGASMAHPVSGEQGWTYGVQEGWVYNDGYGYWYTHGQTGKRFMYDAIIQFKESNGNFQKLAIQAFNDVIAKELRSKSK
jgi:hypothetical protein